MDLVKEFEKTQIKRKFPDIKAGDTIRVHQKIKEETVSLVKDKKAKEEKERIQIFEGVVIRRKGGKGLDGTFTVRKISFGIGVEKTFPIHSPNIVKIEVLKRGKVRRAKLYYLREKGEKEAKLKEKILTQQMLESLKVEETGAAKLKKTKKEKEKEKEKEKTKIESKTKTVSKEKTQTENKAKTDGKKG